MQSSTRSDTVGATPGNSARLVPAGSIAGRTRRFEPQNTKDRRRGVSSSPSTASGDWIGLSAIASLLQRHDWRQASPQAKAANGFAMNGLPHVFQASRTKLSPVTIANAWKVMLGAAKRASGKWFKARHGKTPRRWLGRGGADRPSALCQLTRTRGASRASR